MAIPELDLKKVNLQAAVGYLISLHDNEVDWNLLGIKVVGLVPTAEDIPAGEYEYGDAYEVGTEPPYDMYIYTRPDGKVHTEGYWFPVGKFPMPGPQGPKGDGWGTAKLFQEGITTNLTYDSTNGGKNESISSMTYKDSTTGQLLTQTFQMVSRLPIVPGKYVSMNSTSDNKKMEVKVDDTELALDYYKIKKTTFASVPAYSPTAGRTDMKYTFPETGNSLVQRGANGEARFNWILANQWKRSGSSFTIDFYDTIRQLVVGRLVVNKTTSNTGTLTVEDLTFLRKLPQYQIQYDNQTYYRMDPMDAPDGKLNYIHIDTFQDGNGGYKATGKCFSVNVSTREWKVFDIDFGGKVYQHAIHFEVTGAGTSSNANVWDIELIISSSSPNQITKNTLYKYISTSNYPLQGGTPISVYRERVQGPQGMGIGKMAVQHEVGEISNTDHYIFELMSMDGISETITNRDQNSLSSFVDTVTEV